MCGCGNGALCATHAEELRQTNTRHVAEVERLTAEVAELKRECVARAEKIIALKEANTPLRDALRDAAELFDAIVANTESVETEPLTHPQGVWVTTIQCHAKVGAADIRAVLGKQPAPSPAVTGTASDKTSFRQLAPDECPACRVRGLSMDRLGGACHALECPNPTAWLRARETQNLPTRGL